jgi:glycosyltransferase involved in cell wall biosynthesis
MLTDSEKSGEGDRKAVLFLNPSGQLGGAERSLLDFMASLREAVPEWRLGLILTADGPLAGRARALGVETSVLPLPALVSKLGDGGSGTLGRTGAAWSLLRAAPSAVLYARRLRRAIRRFGPDILHSNGFKMHLLAAWSKPPAVPLVWHVHDFVSRRPVMSLLLRRYVDRCAAVITNSVGVAIDVQDVCGPLTPVHVVYNAIDLSAFRPDGNMIDLDAAAGLRPAAPDTLRVGLVATLGWWKGHEVFLRAIAMLDPELPVRAYVIGGPLYETLGSQHSLEKLRSWAREMEISDRVGFTGFIEDVPAAMRSLDIVVHASTEPEAFGLVIVEGMACSRAVIASRAGGAAELIRDGENALGHRPGDAEDLARCIDVLIRDPETRRRLGVAGRRTAELGFDRARLAMEIRPIYERAVAKVA